MRSFIVCMMSCLTVALLVATVEQGYAGLSVTREVDGICAAAEKVDVTLSFRDALAPEERRIDSMSAVEMLRDGWYAQNASPVADQGSQAGPLVSWTQGGAGDGAVLGNYYCEPSECEGQSDCQPQQCATTAECKTVGGAPDPGNRLCVGTGTITYQLVVPPTLSGGSVAALAGNVKFLRASSGADQPPVAGTVDIAPLSLECAAASFSGARALTPCNPPGDVEVSLEISNSADTAVDVFERFPAGWEPTSITPFATEVRLIDQDDPTSIDWLRWRLTSSSFVGGKATITYTLRPLESAQGGNTFEGGVAPAGLLTSFDPTRMLALRGQHCAQCPGGQESAGCGEEVGGIKGECGKYIKRQLKALSKCNAQLLAKGPAAAKACKSFVLDKPAGCDPNNVIDGIVALAYGSNDQQKDPAGAEDVNPVEVAGQEAQIKCQKSVANAAVGFATKRLTLVQRACIATFKDTNACRDAQTLASKRQLSKIDKCIGDQKPIGSNGRKVPDIGAACSACIDDAGVIDKACVGDCIQNALSDLTDDILVQ